MNIKRILSILVALAMVFVSSVTVVLADEAGQIQGDVMAIEAITEETTEETAETVEDTAAEATAPAADVKFSDIDETTSAGKAIYKLVGAGIVNGYGDGTFLPDGKITRAELCKMVNLVYKYTEADEAQFADVTSEDWFAQQVLVAKKAGYISGYEDGTFRGQRNITRQEFCAIMCRINNYFDLKIKVKVNDKIDDWAAGYVNTVLANSVMVLEDGGNFRATVEITRSEVAVVLASYVQEISVTEPVVNTETKPETKPTVVGGGSGGGGSNGGNNTVVTPSEDDATEDEDAPIEDEAPVEDEAPAEDETPGEETPAEDEKVEEEQKSFAELNADVVAKLTTTKNQLNNIRLRDKTQRQFKTVVEEVINGLIADADKYEFNYGNIFAEYQDQLVEAQGLFDTLVEEGTITVFVDGLDDDLVDFFEKYFGIELR